LGTLPLLHTTWTAVMPNSPLAVVISSQSSSHSEKLQGKRDSHGQY
jgi:hypothetical protein